MSNEPKDERKNKKKSDSEVLDNYSGYLGKGDTDKIIKELREESDKDDS